MLLILVTGLPSRRRAAGCTSFSIHCAKAAARSQVMVAGGETLTFIALPMLISLTGPGEPQPPSRTGSAGSVSASTSLRSSVQRARSALISSSLHALRISGVPGSSFGHVPRLSRFASALASGATRRGLRSGRGNSASRTGLRSGSGISASRIGLRSGSGSSASRTGLRSGRGTVAAAPVASSSANARAVGPPIVRMPIRSQLLSAIGPVQRSTVLCGCLRRTRIIGHLRLHRDPPIRPSNGGGRGRSLR